MVVPVLLAVPGRIGSTDMVSASCSLICWAILFKERIALQGRLRTELSDPHILERTS